MNTQPVEIKNEAGNKLQVAAVPTGALAKAAYERRLAEIQAVPEADLARVAGVDVHAAVATAIGALPAILPLRQAMTALPDLNAPRVDGLSDYAWATSEANTRYGHATAPVEDLGPLLEQATKLRETFRLDAVALVHRGLIDPARVTAFKGLTGYKNVAFELMDWAFVMRESWPQIQEKSSLTPDEIDAATKLGEQLLTEASLREQQPAQIAATALIRQQALTLLINAYDEVQRALTYLRWQEDDMETIAPSLFLKNGRRKAKVDPPPAPAPTPPDGPTPAPAPTPPVTAHPTPAPGMPGAKLLIDG